MDENLRRALASGDPETVAALISAGADIHYQSVEGYDALIHSVYGRESRLIELLTLLIAQGVSLRGKTTYGETGVRVLSRLGRFDAIRLLLDAGANPDDLELTELIQAVAFGTLADVKTLVVKGVDLEGRDHWERTAWLVAIQTGDISKARFLMEHGANTLAQGRCGKPPLFYAVESHRLPMLEWLMSVGADVRQTDDFGKTSLATAVECGDADAVRLLLQTGADVNQKLRAGGALSYADTRETTRLLLDAGADPLELSCEGRRALLGHPPGASAELLRVSPQEFRKHRSPRFGTAVSEPMNNPFWEGMIRSGLNAYQAIVQIEGDDSYGVGDHPVWCAQRFGQSLTFLDDGRIVQVAGEHEDAYDPDFCIYNDVFVHDRSGGIAIYGYPEAVFPPTDFHTATLIGGQIYLIGSLGYPGTRQYRNTPVYRLDTSSFRIHHLSTSGHNPGWIYRHRAMRVGESEIQITGGKVVTFADGKETHSDNVFTFVLNTESLVWSSG